MTIFLYAGSGKKWRTEVVITILQATDAGHGGDRHWPCICQFTLGMVSRGGGDGRADAHATDADISICRSMFGGLASARASDAAPRLSIDRQTHLSWLSGAREGSGPRLTHGELDCWISKLRTCGGERCVRRWGAASVARDF
jgi:hypothetical protein